VITGGEQDFRGVSAASCPVRGDQKAAAVPWWDKLRRLRAGSVGCIRTSTKEREEERRNGDGGLYLVDSVFFGIHLMFRWI